MRRLIHDGTTVELPRPAPRSSVVVVLRSLPSDRRVGEEDPAESPFIDGAAQELYRGIEPILLDDEEKHPGVVARLHQLIRLGRLRRRIGQSHGDAAKFGIRKQLRQRGRNDRELAR